MSEELAETRKKIVLARENVKRAHKKFVDIRAELRAVRQDRDALLEQERTLMTKLNNAKSRVLGLNTGENKDE